MYDLRHRSVGTIFAWPSVSSVSFPGVFFLAKVSLYLASLGNFSAPHKSMGDCCPAPQRAPSLFGQCEGPFSLSHLLT